MKNQHQRQHNNDSQHQQLAYSTHLDDSKYANEKAFEHGGRFCYRAAALPLLFQTMNKGKTSIKDFE